MWKKKRKPKFKVRDYVRVCEPFGIALLHFSGYVICIDMTNRNIWRDIEPLYTVKKLQGGDGVQWHVRESWMQLVEGRADKNEICGS